jgi:RNA polymerase sigma factor (sigma-70 family)
METKNLVINQNTSDEDIIALVKGGQVMHYEKIMRRYNQRLYRIAKGMNIRDADCDDLIQQAYINAYEKLHQFKGESKFSTWLTRILINQCLMHKRRKNIMISDEISDNMEKMERALNKTNTAPENELVQAEIRKILEDAIEYLPEDFKTVYMMREVEGMSVKETSECLAITESNVKIRLYRAKAVMKDYIERYFKAGEIFEFGNCRCDAVVSAVMGILPGLKMDSQV